MNDPKEILQKAIRAFCDEMGLDEEIYLKILSNALIDMGLDIEILHKAIKEGDLTVIQQVSHRIKGTSSNLRLNEIVPIATNLNDLSKQGVQKEKYLLLYVQIENAFKLYQQSFLQ